MLRFLQGRSVIETALAVGKGTDAEKKLQARGLLLLRRLLGGQAIMAEMAALTVSALRWRREECKPSSPNRSELAQNLSPHPGRA